MPFAIMPSSALRSTSKGVLEEQSVPFPRTQDLVVLLDLCHGQVPDLNALRPALSPLTAYATAFRYPGAQVVAADALDAVAIAEHVRRAGRSKFGVT